MAFSQSWHIRIEDPPRSKQASQEMIPTEMISALLLVRASIDDDASLSAALSSLDCSCCAKRALEVELGRESESRRGRVCDKSDMATDPFFSVLRETGEFVVGRLGLIGTNGDGGTRRCVFSVAAAAGVG